jgi:hypothetical protein
LLLGLAQSGMQVGFQFVLLLLVALHGCGQFTHAPLQFLHFVVHVSTSHTHRTTPAIPSSTPATIASAIVTQSQSQASEPWFQLRSAAG